MVGMAVVAVVAAAAAGTPRRRGCDGDAAAAGTPLIRLSDHVSLGRENQVGDLI